MAAGDLIVPASGSSDVRLRDCVRFDSVSADATLSTKPVRHMGCKLSSFYFSGVDNNDDWADPRGVIAAAWQANTIADVGVWRVVTGTGLRFSTGATNPNGWLHVLQRGSIKLTATNDEVPVQKGTAGYLQPGFIFHGHRSASPDTLTRNRIGRTPGLKLQVYPFTITDGDNRWASETARLCPGIVAVAWQGITANDSAAVTQNVNGDVILTTGATGEIGWLWVWRSGGGAAT